MNTYNNSEFKGVQPVAAYVFSVKTSEAPIGLENWKIQMVGNATSGNANSYASFKALSTNQQPCELSELASQIQMLRAEEASEYFTPLTTEGAMVLQRWAAIAADEGIKFDGAQVQPDGIGGAQIVWKKGNKRLLVMLRSADKKHFEVSLYKRAKGQPSMMLPAVTSILKSWQNWLTE